MTESDGSTEPEQESFDDLNNSDPSDVGVQVGTSKC